MEKNTLRNLNYISPLNAHIIFWENKFQESLKLSIYLFDLVITMIFFFVFLFHKIINTITREETIEEEINVQ